jgi:hypothetical protein
MRLSEAGLVARYGEQGGGVLRSDTVDRPRRRRRGGGELVEVSVEHRDRFVEQLPAAGQAYRAG